MNKYPIIRAFGFGIIFSRTAMTFRYADGTFVSLTEEMKKISTKCRLIGSKRRPICAKQILKIVDRLNDRPNYVIIDDIE